MPENEDGAAVATLVSRRPAEWWLARAGLFIDTAERDSPVRTQATAEPGVVLAATSSPSDHEAFASRDLSAVGPLLLFVDGVAAPGSPHDAGAQVLCAWAITWEGRSVLLSLALGSKDSPHRCVELLSDLKRRGLASPLAVITDGDSALLRASEVCFPEALHQRCLVHQIRQLGCRLPRGASATVLRAMQASYEAPSMALAQAMRRDVTARHGASLPSLVAHFERTFESCVACLRLPHALRRLSRATLALEWLLAARQRLEGGTCDLAAATFRPDATWLALEQALDEAPLVRLGDADLVLLDALARDRSSVLRRV